MVQDHLIIFQTAKYEYVAENSPTQGLVVVGGGEEGGSVRIKGEGNLYSGQSIIGGNGGKIWRGEFGNVGAGSFLLAWTLPMDKSDKAMKKDKRSTRREAI